MPHYRGFFDLPLQLRERIYGYADIVGKVINLNTWHADEVFDIEEIEEDWETYNERAYHDIIGQDIRPSCWHNYNNTIVRREQYFPPTEFWGCDFYGDACWDWTDRCLTEECYVYDSCFSLLLASKQIFREVYERIFQSNSFVVDRGQPRGFQAFISLGCYAIQNLTHLTIRLDGEPPEKIDLSAHWSRTSDLLPLKHQSRFGKQAYRDWNSLVRRLRESSIVPQRLKFFLIASVLDIHEARFVLEPLETLPSFKSCGIWLNQKPIPQLQALIKVTVERLTTPKEGEVVEISEDDIMPFRYLDLPQEIRFRILQFSDLCDTSHLEWKPITSLLDRIAPLQKSVCNCHYDLGDIDEDLHFDDCERETRILSRSSGSGIEIECDDDKHCCSCGVPSFHGRFPRDPCKLKNDPYMCIFDCENHSCHLVTGKPRAWQPYCHPLFVVSNQTRQDAISIFFQNRQLVITCRGGLPLRHLKRDPDKYHEWGRPELLPRTELSLFLTSMPKEALRYIRRLEWLMPDPDNYRTLSRPAYFDYLDTIEVMIQAMNLPQLTLVINWRPARNRSYDSEGCGCDFRWPTRSESDGAVYDTILTPLCRLGEEGLKDCWVYLRRIYAGNDVYLDSDEMRWEKKIMRNRRYEAFKRGKPQVERVEKGIGSILVHTKTIWRYKTYRKRFS